MNEFRDLLTLHIYGLKKVQLFKHENTLVMVLLFILIKP